MRSISTIKCDVAMIDPPYYDAYYYNITDINDKIKNTLNERINDKEDGEIYKESLADLELKGNYKINAF
eukprot:jgi/Orpsp1_1/1175527/evm.model.c7180000054212.2